MNDPWLLQRLEAEAALMRHHVAYGVPPARRVCRNGETSRVCRNGHLISPWEDGPHHGCLICVRIRDNRRAAA